MSSLLSKNLSWLSSKNNLLFDFLHEQGNPESFYLESEDIYKNESGESFSGFTEEVSESFVIQTNNPNRIQFNSLVTNSCDEYNNLGFEQLYNQQLESRDKGVEHDKCIICLGASMLKPLVNSMSSVSDTSDIGSIVVIDANASEIAALFSTIDFENTVKEFRARNISLSFLCHRDIIMLKEIVYDFFAFANPFFLFNAYVYKSPFDSEKLLELKSWLFSPDGIYGRYMGNLGYSDDEINQIYAVYVNKLLSKNGRHFSPLHTVDPSYIINKSTECNYDKPSLPVVIVGSGPSLDSCIEWLKDNQQNFYIVAAGSSLGTLVRNNIHVSCAVQLERGGDVFDDIFALVDEGFDLSSTVFAGSYSVDYRISYLFKETIYFHRPHSSAVCLNYQEYNYSLINAGPEAVNSAVSLMLQCGIKDLILLGADFGSPQRSSYRSEQAIGTSPRQLNIPVKSNFNNTFFSDVALLLVRDALESLIMRFPEATIYRLGEGVQLTPSKNVSTNQLEELFLKANNHTQSNVDELLLSSSHPSTYSKESLILEIQSQIESTQSFMNAASMLFAQVKDEKIAGQKLKLIDNFFKAIYLPANRHVINRTSQASFYLFAKQALYEVIREYRRSVLADTNEIDSDFMQNIQESILYVPQYYCFCLSHLARSLETVQIPSKETQYQDLYTMKKLLNYA